MGMFDTIFVWPRGRLRCAEGHVIDGLQTKDLDCAMDEYVLCDDRLFRVVKDGQRSVERERGLPVLRTTWRTDVVLPTTAIDVYAHCEECRPVLYVGGPTSWGDLVHERWTWAEWRLEFKEGRLVGLEPVRVETRSALAETMRKEGLEVLDDDERLARLHFNRRRGESKA